MRPLSRIVWTLSLVFAAVLLIASALGLYLDNLVLQRHAWESGSLAPGEVNVIAWSRILRTALIAGGAILLMVALVWLLVRRPLDRRVETLAAGLKKLEEGDLGFRFEIREKDEFSTLARAFNAMAAKLEPRLRELSDTRDYFEGIVENSADIIITVSPSGYVYTFNRGAEASLGYERSEVIGRRIAMLFSDPGERDAAMERLENADNILNYETRFLTKEGAVRDVMLTLSRLRDLEGSTVGLFGIAKDVTESKRLQKKLLHAERFAAIGQALAGIQHGMKNMLNALKGGAYMVKLGLSKDDRGLLVEGWDMVQEGIENITSMSLAMLNYVKEWKPEFEHVDISAMVREIERMFRPTAEDQGVALRVDVLEEPPLVLCDARLVHSAVMDILSNAMDACLEKEYEEGESAEISVWAHPSTTGSEFVLAIGDNGCGMSPQVRASVFTPFFSTKERLGTGLGLALTARTIRLHGGEIEVESEVNVGSEFRIIVPMSGPGGDKEEPDGQESAGR